MTVNEFGKRTIRPPADIFFQQRPIVHLSISFLSYSPPNEKGTFPRTEQQIALQRISVPKTAVAPHQSSVEQSLKVNGKQDLEENASVFVICR
jgi:hypothetical protein